jgi:hypothetical protein
MTLNSSLKAKSEKVKGYEITPTIATQIDSFVAEGRPVAPRVIDIFTSGDVEPVADTTVTCNDSTNICTCQSTSNRDCGQKLRALCEDVVDWSGRGFIFAFK